MRNQFLVLVAFFAFIVPSLAQDFQGKAIYQSKTSMGDFNFGNRQISEDQKKRMMERMKDMFEKTFVLHFDKSVAMYSEEEKLEAMSSGRGGGMRFGGFGGSGKLYKNLKDQSFTNETEMFGKVFLIKDKLEKLEWKMGTESKKIGNYTAYKATAIKPVDTTSFEAMRQRRQRENDKEIADKEAKKDSTKSNSFFTAVEEPKEIEITAWFTPEIPISQGPGEYWGLPGLILEVSAGNTVILCTKIVMNSEEKVTLEAPKKGKIVSQIEYNKIMMDKMEEMTEQFRGRGGSNSIRIGN
ncbi:GLPGLI family protein [Cellulophaga sp. Hel_I_12]|uniref:GLPGLI family protein n=1 Tax=Cellulophaga sp. Hel_I_12 TaxID=1249972 RepID=UPI00064858A0|nr:GLPGLI family protein [Cellulophaga sp. Hel_I_12]